MTKCIKCYCLCRDMSDAEATSICKLANSARHVLSNEWATHLLSSYIKDRKPGDNVTLDCISTYQECAGLQELGNEEAFPQEKVNKLMSLLPSALGNELGQAAAPNNNDRINILQRIQHFCITEIEFLTDLEDFREDLQSLILA